MTQRTEFQHRVAEFKMAMKVRVANRLFTFRRDGIDGFLKRRLMGDTPKQGDARKT